MRKSILSLAILLSLLATITQAQTEKLSMTLSKKATDPKLKEEKVRVDIFLSYQTSLADLKQQIEVQKMNVSERALFVVNQLHLQNTQHQQNLLRFLEKNSTKIKIIKSLWIVNMVIAEVDCDFLTTLAQNPDIKQIEASEDHKASFIAPISRTEATPKLSPAGHEAGLTAVKAPEMWAMGYTGHGRRSFSVDTGVWIDHPALGNRFLGFYVPLTQAWLPAHSQTPVDLSGSHGTHTLGTTLGMDPQTHDTVGLAFKAYFIATDPIVEDLAYALSLGAIVDVYQWALNPDSNFATTNDIPDAINNSWGYHSYSDTCLCNTPYSLALDAVELAGIANVFSAGNEGPNPGTISGLQTINTNLVNVFTVGSLDANSSGYPISDFSSRGPTWCPGTGSLKIKPEVSAPGQNVRSSIGHNAYAYLSGTSMAGPHVTGAVLLLKEAFPQATGHDILMALYNTAMDLGVAGEDNTYGNGLINTYAAYQSLAQTYTPAIPAQNHYDPFVKEIQSPNDIFACGLTHQPKVVISNSGDSTVHGYTVYYHFNNEPELSFHTSINLTPGKLDTLNLPAITAQHLGKTEFFVRIKADSNFVDYDSINNQLVKRLDLRSNYTLPYFQGFDQGTILSNDWILNNPDFGITWDTITVQGGSGSTKAVYMKCSNYTPISSQKDELLSPLYNIPDSNQVKLQFMVAYRYAGPSSMADTLKVLASPDCGNSFAVVYAKAGQTLSTISTSSGTAFYPQQASDWRQESIDLSAYKNQNIILKFQSTNRHGNNLFLDDIHFYAGTNTGIEKLMQIAKWDIYPNPAQDILYVRIENQQSKNSMLNLYSVDGVKIKSIAINSSMQSINLKELPKAIYMIEYVDGTSRSMKRFIKTGSND